MLILYPSLIMRKQDITQCLTQAIAELEIQFPEVVGMTHKELYQFFIGEITTKCYANGFLRYRQTIVFVRGTFKDVRIPSLDDIGLARAHEVRH